MGYSCQTDSHWHQIHTQEHCFEAISKTVFRLLFSFCSKWFGHTSQRPSWIVRAIVWSAQWKSIQRHLCCLSIAHFVLSALQIKIVSKQVGQEILLYHANKQTSNRNNFKDKKFAICCVTTYFWCQIWSFHSLIFVLPNQLEGQPVDEKSVVNIKILAFDKK